LKHEKHAYIKDGLAAYRNITQASNVSSLETVLKKYVNRVEQSFK
jgi:translation initiation factor 3 subunit A